MSGQLNLATLVGVLAMRKYNKNVAVSVFGLFLLCGCNGQLYHGPEAAADVIKQCGSNNVHCGVPFPLLVTGVQTSQTTVLVDDKGKVTATASGTVSTGTTGKCEPITSQQIVTVADTDNLQTLWYQPGFLETVKFNAVFNANGTLASVGTEATPDQGKTFQNTAAGIGSLASAAAGLIGGSTSERTGGGRSQTRPTNRGEALPACNSGLNNVSFAPIAFAARGDR
jgi:hypothetical protein